MVEKCLFFYDESDQSPLGQYVEQFKEIAKQYKENCIYDAVLQAETETELILLVCNTIETYVEHVESNTGTIIRGWRNYTDCRKCTISSVAIN